MKNRKVSRLASNAKPSRKMNIFCKDILDYANENDFEVTGLVRNKKTGAVVCVMPELDYTKPDEGPLYLMKVVHELQHQSEAALIDSVSRKNKATKKKARTS